ncbi:MAG: DedA family protein [Candidatus Liptonbacteria bacterium]|nr:DedA family protein [Candidatus Liptonbacteria bacterium]
MPPELADYIVKYGYLAIFSLVFLQEIGVPNPVPNELVLLFSGYLAYTGTLSFTLVFFSAVMGDILGTSLLFAFFYIFGKSIMEKKPGWLPIKKEKIEKLTKLISGRDRWGVFVGRLIPYVRGYASVAAGLIQFPPKVFLTMVALSAALWSGGYVFIGSIMGKYWEKALAGFLGTSSTVYTILAVILVIFFGRHIAGHFIRKHKLKKEINPK